MHENSIALAWAKRNGAVSGTLWQRYIRQWIFLHPGASDRFPVIKFGCFLTKSTKSAFLSLVLESTAAKSQEISFACDLKLYKSLTLLFVYIVRFTLRTSGGEYLYLATATLLNCGRDELLLSETFGGDAEFLDELCQSRSSRPLKYWALINLSTAISTSVFEVCWWSWSLDLWEETASNCSEAFWYQEQVWGQHQCLVK